MTRRTGAAKQLMIFITESDHHHHHPLYVEIVHRAHAAGLAGASVLRGIEGFGARRIIHTTRLLSLTEDLPIVIVIVDEEHRIEAFIDQLGDVIIEGVITVTDVEVVRYAEATAERKGRDA